MNVSSASGATRAAVDRDGTAPLRVLLVDDRPEMRRLLRTRLELEDDMVVVGEATNGAEAIGLSHALAPRAIVLDLEMPVMTGTEAIPFLRIASPGVVIVLFTAAAVIDLATGKLPDAVVDKASVDAVVVRLRELAPVRSTDRLAG